jgi:hypothetical protein
LFFDFRAALWRPASETGESAGNAHYMPIILMGERTAAPALWRQNLISCAIFQTAKKNLRVRPRVVAVAMVREN